jgi:hypothetical protein
MPPPGGWQPQPGMDPKAQAKAAKAYAKASRPWFKKKRWWLLGVVILIIIIVAASSGGGSGNGNSGGTASAACVQNYPDKQPDNDHCADANGTVKGVGNFDVTAQPFVYKQIQFIGKSLCSQVSMFNKTDDSQDYNVLDFKVQTPSGDVATLSSVGIGGTLNSGTMIAGGTKRGKICTDYKGPGQYVLIFKPGLISDNRGIWLFDVKQH